MKVDLIVSFFIAFTIPQIFFLFDFNTEKFCYRNQINYLIYKSEIYKLNHPENEEVQTFYKGNYLLYSKLQD